MPDPRIVAYHTPAFVLEFKMGMSHLFQKIIQHLEREGLKNVIFTNCVKDENVKQVGFWLFYTLMLLLKYIQEAL